MNLIITLSSIIAVFIFSDVWLRYQKRKATANTASTSRKTILDQMNEPRPLPMGQKEFVAWTDRIISGALIPCEDWDSLVAALSAMLMQLGPTESHKPDAYFIHALRKAAVNEVAHSNFQAIKKRKEEKTKETVVPLEANRS